MGGESSGFKDPWISPDGRRVVAELDGDLWLIDMDSDSASQFTFDPDNSESSQIWSKDSTQIIYRQQFQGRGTEIRRKLASGSGIPETLIMDSGFPTSHGGTFVIYTHPPLPVIDLYILPLNGDGEPRPYLTNPDYVERRGQLSPDGNWVAYESTELGTSEVFVRPFPDAAGGQRRVSTDGGTFSRWSRDGQELYYMAPGGKLMAAPIVTSNDVFQPGTPY